jgi:type IV secretory pathway TraG/TraD family ATPase VirD4
MEVPKTDKYKEVMLTIATGFLALHLIFHWEWAVYVSLGVGVVGVFSRWVSKQVSWVWFGLATILGKIVSNVLLTLVFFLFLTPLAFFYKLFNKDPLKLKSKYPSYFVTRDIIFSKESFEKPW